MPNQVEVIRHSRPRAEADWECPRKLYYLREFDGIGLNPDIESLEMFFGSSIHDGLAAIASMHPKVDIDAIGEAAFQQVKENLVKNGVGTDEEVDNFSSEQACLAEGLLRGFYKHAWPGLLRRYPKIVAVERDVIFKHTFEGLSDPAGLFEFHAKPDLILSTEDGSEVIYNEYKTSSNKKEQWINSWDKSIQAHATLAAINQTLGLDLAGIIVQGLYKGYASYGKLSTPLAYAYHRYGNPPFTKTETIYEWKAGFKKYPVWHLEGGVKKWIESMPEEVLMEQFPCTPLIFPDEDLITRFFKQRAIRETEVKAASKLIQDETLAKPIRDYALDHTFPQHFNKCKPAWGFECAFQQLCHGQVSDPVKAGFTYREKRY